MRWAVFRKSVRDSWKGMIGWGVGLGLYAIMVIGLYPSVAAERETYEKLIESYPESIMQMFGNDLFSPAGYLNSQMMLYVPLLLGIYAILQGLNAVTGEERRQTMDMLAALPLPRWQIILEKFLATVVILTVVLAEFYLFMLFSIALWPEMDVSAGSLAVATFGNLFLVLTTAGVAYLLSALLPMRRRWGGAISTVYLVGTSLIFSLGNASDKIKPFQPYTAFDYFDAQAALTEGLVLGDTLVLVAATLILLAASVFAFERRDLGT
jgi:ABC-2 type transport system permease protein